MTKVYRSVVGCSLFHHPVQWAHKLPKCHVCIKVGPLWLDKLDLRFIFKLIKAKGIFSFYTPDGILLIKTIHVYSYVFIFGYD